MEKERKKKEEKKQSRHLRPSRQTHLEGYSDAKDS